MEYGLTTLGATLWAAESTDGKKVTDASKYKRIARILSTGEVTVEPDNIDVTAVEDKETHYKAGRSTVTETYSVEYLVTNETNAAWKAIAGKTMCFLEDVEDLDEQCFIIAQVPSKLPKAPLENGSAYSSTINCTLNDYIGYDTRVEVSDEETDNTQTP